MGMQYNQKSECQANCPEHQGKACVNSNRGITQSSTLRDGNRFGQMNSNQNPNARTWGWRDRATGTAGKVHPMAIWISRTLKSQVQDGQSLGTPFTSSVPCLVCLHLCRIIPLLSFVTTSRLIVVTSNLRGSIRFSISAVYFLTGP
jgi:hypothetical protein